MIQRPLLPSLSAPGLLAALSVLAGPGCSVLIGADFDKPFETSSTSSTTGSTGSTTTGATVVCGGACSTAEDGALIPNLDETTAGRGACHFGTFDCKTNVCKGARGPVNEPVCGPNGKDADCDGVTGAGQGCAMRTIEVLVQADSACGLATDALQREALGEPVPEGWTRVSAFQLFAEYQTDTYELRRCVSKTTPQVHSMAINAKCADVSPDFEDEATLGYFSSKAAVGYEEAQERTVVGQTHVLIARAQKDTACCGQCVSKGQFLPGSPP